VDNSLDALLKGKFARHKNLICFWIPGIDVMLLWKKYLSQLHILENLPLTV